MQVTSVCHYSPSTGLPLLSGEGIFISSHLCFVFFRWCEFFFPIYIPPPQPPPLPFSFFSLPNDETFNFVPFLIQTMKYHSINQSLFSFLPSNASYRDCLVLSYVCCCVVPLCIIPPTTIIPCVFSPFFGAYFESYPNSLSSALRNVSRFQP